MSRVTVDKATGALRVAGAKAFPLGLSNPPPLGGKAPNGLDAFKEIADGGASFIRTGRGDWGPNRLDEQLAAERAVLDAAAAHGLHCWLYLGELPDLPPRAAGTQASTREQMLTRVATTFKDHPGLGAYKGVDEPRNPFRGENWIRPAGLVRAARRLKALDPQHPLVIIQAPRSTVAQLAPYRPAFDITGADIFPVAYPPGEHSDLPNKDISVVGDVTRKMVRAAGGKPVWMTLQIAWSGTVTSARKPNVVPRFPTLHELRFMAYEAIVCGARGLMFFGGHLTQVSRPADAEAGWNWTFWEQVLRPLLQELSSTAIGPALVARGREAAGQVERQGRRSADPAGRPLPLRARRPARRGHEPRRLHGPAQEAERAAAHRRTGAVRVRTGAAAASDRRGPPGVQVGERRRWRIPRLARIARRPRLPFLALMNRCAWVPEDDPLYVAYHDEEWGIPVRDERALFELLNLEGAQAGLSWSTILRKREGYRNAFAGWEIEAIARFGERDVERLLGDAGIVRHRGKIESVIDERARDARARRAALGAALVVRRRRAAR